METSLAGHDLQTSLGIYKEFCFSGCALIPNRRAFFPPLKSLFPTHLTYLVFKHKAHYIPLQHAQSTTIMKLKHLLTAQNAGISAGVSFA